MAAHDEDDDNSNAADEMAWSRLNNIETKTKSTHTNEEIIIIKEKSGARDFILFFSSHN